MRRTGSLRGRADELADILRFVNDDGVSLVTLTGRGGVGKTALAREVARELRGVDPWRDVTFVELDTVSDARDVIRRIAGELGLIPTAGDVTEPVAARLGQSPSVLVIDNMEHVLDAAVELSELLDRCPTLTALVTSQWPLQLRGEQVLRVMPLELPEFDVDPAALLTNPAVAMYCDRAREMNHRFDPDDAAVRAIAELCRRLDGLPLAIELAAASSVSLSATGLMERLDERPLGVLCGRLRDAPPRHRDLRGAIQWTLDLLRPRQQVLLARLSVVNGRFPLDVVESLSDRPEDALDDLADLVDLHLVEPQSDIDEPWFRLHPTIRAFATERLQESGDRPVTVERHVAGAASWARGAGAACEATGRVGDLGLRRDDLTACVHLALGADLVVPAVDLVLGMAPMWLATGYGWREVAMVDDVLERARREGIESAALASLLSWSVRLDAELRADVCPRSLGERLADAESMARRCADRHAMLRVLAAEVFVGRVSGDRASANTAARNGLRAAVDVGDDVWVASFEMWVGMLSHMDHDLERATTYGRRALDRARRVGDVRTEILATVLLRDLATKYPAAADGTESTATLIDLARRSGQHVVAGVIAPFAAGEAIRDGDLRLAADCLDGLLAASHDSPPIEVGLTLFVAQMFCHEVQEHRLTLRIEQVVHPYRAALGRWLTPDVQRRVALAVTAATESIRHDAPHDAPAADEDLDVQVVAGEFRRMVGTRFPNPPTDDSVGPRRVLTARQNEVVQLVAEGLTNREIGQRLHVTPKTVMHHLTAAYRAMGVRRRSEATAWVFRNRGG